MLRALSVVCVASLTLVMPATAADTVYKVVGPDGKNHL